MESLETLLTELGLTEHMELLSNWRDDFLREKAEELQGVHMECASLVLTAASEKSSEIEAKNAEVREIRASYSEEIAATRESINHLEMDLATANELLARKNEQIESLQSAVSGANAIISGHVRTIQSKDSKIDELQALLYAPEKERKRMELQAQLAALDE